MKKVKYFLGILFCVTIGFSWGQGEKKMIQFSGLVVEGDSLLGIFTANAALISGSNHAFPRDQGSELEASYCL